MTNTHRQHLKMLFLVSLIATFLLLSACSSPAPVRSGKPIVVTTIYPLYDFARAVAGDKADVVLLMPPGAEPHEFEPKPSDIATLSGATLVIYNGANMDDWAVTLLDNMGKRRPPALEAATVSSLLAAHHDEDAHDDAEGEPDAALVHDDDHEHGAYDPHLWLDAGNAITIVTAIAERLAALDPANAPSYKANADAYNAQLTEVDASYRAGLADCKHREFITGGHAAFGYLANRYGLVEVSAYGISPNAEPSLKHIRDLAALAKTKGITVIYFEDLVNPAMAQTIADEVGAKTMVLNAGHEISIEQREQGVTLVQIFKDDLAALRAGLECS